MDRILTISKDYKADPTTAEVDMSAHAVTVRLKRVSQLRRLCVSLGKAEIRHAERELPDDSEDRSGNDDSSDS